jgi:hypothetical protein
MGRLPDIDEVTLTPEQRRIYDQLMAARGHVRGPFGVWLRNAELCENTLKLQEMFASRVKLERRLVQLMILVAARLATAQYAWFIHEPTRLKPGSRPGSLKPSASGAPRSSPARTNVSFMTSPWNSIRPGHYLRQITSEGWQCWENRQWSSWSARLAST